MASTIPENGAPFTLEEVVRATGGQVIARGRDRAMGVTTDSRGEVAGKLFVALSGEHFDGHAFIDAALERGAAGLLVAEDVSAPPDSFVVRVPSTLNALGALAHWHRQRWAGTVIAVGGSAGKTTTRSAISALLETVAPGAVHYARGNLNNQVGLPMVLLGVQSSHRYAVVEVGTNLRGEIQKLAGVCQPDLAVLTLIAIEHSEGLGGLDDVEVEEGDLLAAVGAAGTVVVNGDDRRARRQLARSPAATQLCYGRSPDCAYRLLAREPRGTGALELAVERKLDGRIAELTYRAQVIGEPGALATLAALSVADRLGPEPVDGATATQAFDRPDVFEPGRLSPVLLADGTLVLDDTYNANPASVVAAVKTARELAEARGGRLLLVIGEMRELGARSREEHAEVGRGLCDAGAAELLAVGGDATYMIEPARARGLDARFAADAGQALELLLPRVRPGDVVLVKASRGVRAERVVSGLVSAKGAAA